MAAERRTPESPRTRGPQCALSRPVPPRSAPAPPPPPGPAPVPAAQRNSPPHVRPSPRRAASPRPVSTAGTRGGGRVTCAASALSSPQRLAGARTFRAVPPRLSLTVGGGASVFIKLAGHGSQVPGFGCAPGAVTRAELCWGKVAASLHSTRTPPTLRESLGLLPRSQEGPTPTLCQPPDIVPPPGVCTPESPSESCHLQGRA